MSHSAKNVDLHGSAPDSCPVAVLVLDVINAFDFPGAEPILAETEKIVPNVRRLLDNAHVAGVPVLYVNDNFGRWRSDFRTLVGHCSRPESRGCRIVEQLRPADDDYFVLKPKHSGFFGTTLDVLLDYLHAHTLVLAGITADMCVMFTAHDAYIRDFHLVVPRDCVASASREITATSLAQIERVLKADTRPVDRLDFSDLLARAACEPGEAKGRK